MSQHRETCYWCGRRKTSDEHVPPRNLFPAGTNLNLITVPSCKRHNEDFHLLDERFRVFLQGASHSEIAAKLFADKTVRGLMRSKGLSQSIVDASVPASLNGSQTFAISVSDEYHDPYFEKIARALYFHHYKERYRGELRCVCSHFHKEQIDFTQLILLYQSVKSSLQAGQATNTDVFHYEFGRVIEPAGEGFFLHLNFYSDITVFCLGTPKPGLMQRVLKKIKGLYNSLRVVLRLNRRIEAHRPFE